MIQLDGPEVRVLRDSAALLWNSVVVCARETLRCVLPSQPPKNLAGEIALVTGSAHGVGREIALQLARQGVIVVCWDVDDVGNTATVNAINKKRGRAIPYTVDVSQAKMVASAAKRVRCEVGPVTILINNAGLLRYKSFLELEERDVLEHFNVNVMAHFWTLKAFLPHMLEAGHGHVVAMSSMNGLVGSARKTAYCSSKYAIRGLMEALREELRRDSRGSGIVLTVVYPFWIDTGFADDPHYRWQWLFRAVSPSDAAKRIVHAMRQNTSELTIPRPLLWANALHRLFPRKVFELFVDYWEGGDHTTRENQLDDDRSSEIIISQEADSRAVNTA